MNSPLSRSRLAAKRDRRRKVLQMKLRSSMKLKRIVHSKWAEPRARLTILLAVAVLFACGALLWQSFSTTASAQAPEPVLVRGDGYQVLEGLDLVSISVGGYHSEGDAGAPDAFAAGVCGLLADGNVVCWDENSDLGGDAGR